MAGGEQRRLALVLVLALLGLCASFVGPTRPLTTSAGMLEYVCTRQRHMKRASGDDLCLRGPVDTVSDYHCIQITLVSLQAKGIGSREC
jgi:hypothetical protein